MMAHTRFVDADGVGHLAAWGGGGTTALCGATASIQTRHSDTDPYTRSCPTCLPGSFLAEQTDPRDPDEAAVETAATELLDAVAARTADDDVDFYAAVCRRLTILLGYEVAAHAELRRARR